MCATIAAATVPFLVRPPASAVQPDAVMPWDVVSNLLEACLLSVPEEDRLTTTQLVSLEQNTDGTIRAQLGSFGAEQPTSEGWAGTDEVIINDGATADFNACIGGYRVELQQRFRSPTEAERLLLHDWVRRVQQPCLAAHGIPVEPPSYAMLINPEAQPWRMPDTTGMEFEAVLALRLDCPPVPDFLHRQGIAGF